ncbi:MAG: hypothetical protein BGO10_06350 [Chlamydia sp. 32-24]|nr:MAG: hypothetical protein BGO10_06350 [Chlamydia sp. 32-24]
MGRVLTILSVLLVLIAGVYYFFEPSEKYKILPLKTQDMEIAATSPVIDDNWHEFVSPSGKFKVMMPVEPQKANDIFVDPDTKQKKDYYMYVAQTANGTVFMVSLIAFGKDEDGDVRFKDIVKDMMASDPKNVLSNMHTANYQGHEARDFDIENEKMKIMNRAFVKKDKIYLLSAITPKGVKDPDVNLFLNSFEFIEVKR